MPKKGTRERQSFTVTIEKESFDIVKGFCEKTGQDISGIVDTYFQSMARTIRVIGLDKKKDVTRADLLRVALKGVCESP